MTTKYNIGDRAYFLSRRGIVGIQNDAITQIVTDEKGTKYRIDNYLMSEGELFDNPESLIDRLKESVNEIWGNPINE